MTADFYQSLNNGDWLAWTAVCAGALELVLLSVVAWVGSEQ